MSISRSSVDRFWHEKLFPVAMFLSAGLLFAVQPLLGKQMLPLVGGSPSGWLTALAFFQLALLGGYLVAHLLSRLSARTQVLTTVGLLALGAVVLPPAFGMTAADGVAANVGSATQVLQLLFGAIFLPYLGLATVSSGLQRLYAARTAGQDPYFLYAASNAGSFAGLLAYPLVVEPFLPLSVQGVVWTVGYGLLVALIALLAWPKLVATVALGSTTAAPAAAGKDAAPTETVPAETVRAETVTVKQRLHWVILSFIPSSLSMGLTALITADFGSTPLFWVIPLALYLLSFVLAFARRQFIALNQLDLLRLLSIVPLLLLYMRGDNLVIREYYWVILPIGAFFFTAWWSHARLANLRPREEHLTDFYLWVSVGGALGGCFNAFAAPWVFTFAAEFMTVLLLSLLFSAPHAMPRFIASTKPVFVVLAIFVCTGYYQIRALTDLPDSWRWGLFTIPALSLLLLYRAPKHLMFVGIYICLMVSPVFLGIGHVAVARNFFGTYTIVDGAGRNGKTYRMLYHGGMMEGMQPIAPERVSKPHIYFWPMHDLFETFNYRTVAMVGFGTGTALCFNDGSRKFTAFEVNPLVVDLARQWFTYIEDCGEPKLVLGDARLSLLHDKDSRYDLIFLDAFSSASLPSHLITREAVALYLRRMNPAGMMLWNVNSVYYDMAAPLAALGHDAGLQVWKRYDEIGDVANDIVPSHFILLARAEQDLSVLRQFGWEQLPKPDFPVWTDDFRNILGALRVVNHAKTQ